jgi:hypothetical protein
MEMSEQQVDLGWYDQHCLGAAAGGGEGGRGQAAAGGCASSQQEAQKATCGGDNTGGSALGQCSADGLQGGQKLPEYSNATALPCDVDTAAGLLPIPVIRTKQLPAQVKKLLKAAQAANTASRSIQEAA